MEYIPSQPPVVVLIGKLGSGKSTIYNLITNSRVETKAGACSVTRSVNCATCKRGQFFVIDTPGLQETDDVVSHVGAQLAALQTIPVSCIVYVEKVDRAACLSKKLKESMHIIGRNYPYAILVTHTDELYAKLENEEEELKETRLLREHVSKTLEVQGDVLMFVSSPGKRSCIPRTPAEEVISHVTKWLSPHPIRIELSERQRHSLASMGCMPGDAEVKLTEAEDKIRAVIEFASTLPVCAESDELLLDLQRLVGVTVDETKHKCYTYCYGQPLEHLLYWQINARLNFVKADAMKMCRGKMTWDIEDPSHLKNQLRKCPNDNCGLVWVKVEGCDGATTCGNRPSANYQKDVAQASGGMGVLNPLSFIVSYFFETGRYFVRKVVNPRRQASCLPSAQPTNLSPLGCGQQFVWSTAPCVPDHELHLFKCFLHVENKLEEHVRERAEERRQQVEDVNAISIRASFNQAKGDCADSAGQA